MTPRQFDALWHRHRYRVESNELLFAQLTDWVAKTGFRTTEKPTSPRDFMPSEWVKKHQQPLSSRDPEQISPEEQMQSIFAFDMYGMWLAKKAQQANGCPTTDSA